MVPAVITNFHAKFHPPRPILKGHFAQKAVDFERVLCKIHVNSKFFLFNKLAIWNFTPWYVLLVQSLTQSFSFTGLLRAPKEPKTK